MDPFGCLWDANQLDGHSAQKKSDHDGNRSTSTAGMLQNSAAKQGLDVQRNSAQVCWSNFLILCNHSFLIQHASIHIDTYWIYKIINHDTYVIDICVLFFRYCSLKILWVRLIWFTRYLIKFVYDSLNFIICWIFFSTCISTFSAFNRNILM